MHRSWKARGLSQASHNSTRTSFVVELACSVSTTAIYNGVQSMGAKVSAEKEKQRGTDRSCGRKGGRGDWTEGSG